MYPVVVLAGGLGTRVASLTDGIVPKALLQVEGRPFIDRKVEELSREGVDRIVLLVGHQGSLLRAHLPLRDLGAQIEVIEDGPTLLGTVGAIVAALDRLPEAFWVTYGDTFLAAPMHVVERHFQESGATALMTVLRNEDRWQRSNVSVDKGRVVAYDKDAAAGEHAFIDYGLLLFKRSAFDGLARGTAVDLREVIEPLVADRTLVAFEVAERFHDIGTPEALAETEKWIRGRERTEPP